MPNEQTKQLTFGAMMIALFTILLAVSFYVPVVSLFTSLFIAIPIAWYSAKFNRKASILVTVVSIFMSILVGGWLAVPFAMIHALLGFIIGDAIRLKKSKLFMLLSTGIVLLLTISIQYVISVLLFEFNPVKELMALTTDQYDQMGVFLERFNALPKDYEMIVADALLMFQTVLPSLIVISLFLFVYVFIQIQLPVLKKLGLDVPKFPAFQHMKLPKSVLWYYMIVLVITLFVELDKGTFAFMAFANVALLLRVLLFLQGVSFVRFYVTEQRWPKWASIIATILAFPLQSLTLLLGVFDIGFNLRSYVKNKNIK